MKTNYLVFDPKVDQLDTFLKPAAEAILKGRSVVVPTETVYGVAALMLSSSGLESLFELKGRSKDKPLAVLVASLSQVELIADSLPPLFYKVAKAFLPGPLTVIVKAKPGLSPLVTMNGGIAIRYSSHMIPHRLVQLAGAPLALTSANISGLPSVVTGKDAQEELEGRVDTILDDGVAPLGFESTILSLLDPARPKLLREGIIGQEEIEAVIGMPIEKVTPTPLVRAKPKHACFYVSDEAEIKAVLAKHPEMTKALIVDSTDSMQTTPVSGCDLFHLKDNNLYVLLRQLQKTSYEALFVMTAPGLENKPLLQRKLQKIS